MIKSLYGLYEVLSTVDEKNFSIYERDGGYYVDFGWGFPITKQLFYLVFENFRQDFTLSDLITIIAKQRTNKLNKILW